MRNDIVSSFFIQKIHVFWSIRRARYAFIVIAAACTISFPAEFIANSKPLFISYHGQWYFPVLKNYRGSDFAEEIMILPDYKSMEEKILENGWMLRPLIWWGYNETNPNPAAYPSPPSSENILGTDNRGRDVLVRLIYGFRLSLLVGLVTLIISAFIGIFLGGVQGFFGGRIDLLLQRIIEVWVGMPPLLIIILLSHLFSPNVLILTFCLASFLWISPQYHIRGECLKIQNMEYVQAARSFGISSWTILARHVLPNAITPLITLAPFIINSSILSLSFLDYLGLGVQAPSASLGELLRQGRKHILQCWWLSVCPLVVLSSTLLLLNFIGDGLRCAFDPRFEQKA